MYSLEAGYFYPLCLIIPGRMSLLFITDWNRECEVKNIRANVHVN